MNAWLRYMEAVLVWFKRFWSCTTGLSDLFDNFQYCLRIYLQPSSNFPLQMSASSITWLCKSLDSGTPCLKFLPSLFIANDMACQTADDHISGAKMFLCGRVNVEV